jgi:hypothetical protein
LQREGTQWLPLGGAGTDPVDVLIAPWRQQLPAYFERIDRGAPMPAIGSECVYCPVRGVCLQVNISGEATKSEALGLGDHEFVPWHLGIVS